MQLDNSLSQRQGLAQETTAGGTPVRYAQRVGSLKLTLNLANQGRGRPEPARDLRSVGQLDSFISARRAMDHRKGGENHGN